MKVSEITLEYAKKYLNVDHNLDDLRLQAHIATAKNYIKLAHAYEKDSELEENEILADLMMVIIQDLYDNGKITTQNSIHFMSMDRRF